MIEHVTVKVIPLAFLDTVIVRSDTSCSLPFNSDLDTSSTEVLGNFVLFLGWPMGKVCSI